MGHKTSPKGIHLTDERLKWYMYASIIVFGITTRWMRESMATVWMMMKMMKLDVLAFMINVMMGWTPLLCFPHLDSFRE